MNEPLVLWFLQMASTGILVGFIWVIQLVVYPGFLRVGAESFKNYHYFYTRKVTPLVFVFMVSEVAISLWIFQKEPSLFWAQMNLATVFSNWILTAFWAGPLHTKLSKGASLEKILPQLLLSNLLRSLVWTARLAVLVWILIL